jgi:hypothetical protein
MRLLLHDRFASFLLPLCAVFSLPSLSMADEGAVRLLERKGPYQIAVFTAPTPLSAGPVDVSVLVQNADTERDYFRPARGGLVEIGGIYHRASGDRASERRSGSRRTAAAIFGHVALGVLARPGDLALWRSSALGQTKVSLSRDRMVDIPPTG